MSELNSEVAVKLHTLYGVVGPVVNGYCVVKEWKESGGKMFHVFASTGEPAYVRRFNIVMPFATNGLAAVGDEAGMFHIKTDGQSAYSETYDYVDTFSDQKNVATVRKASDVYQLHFDGNTFSKIPRIKTF